MSMQIIPGDLHTDDRGMVGFVNDCRLDSVKRFYYVQNHKSHFVRAWHGHKKEEKYVTVLRGAAVVAGVRIDDWQNPSKDLDIEKYVLSANKPTVVHIPAGYANGMMNLTEDTLILIFSTFSLDGSLTDNIRFPSRYWDPWHIEER